MDVLPEDTEIGEAATVLRDQYMPAILKHREKLDLLKACNEERAAQDEWDTLEKETGVNTIHYCSRIITYSEALCHFKEKDLSSYMSNISVSHRRGIKLLLHWLLGPPRLKLPLVPERDFVLALAQCPFDNDDMVHLEALQTIYRKLTNAMYDCPRYGNHWENIGFQGTDPATDLRGVGLLGLLQLLFLTIGLENVELVNDIYKLSRDSFQNFPFAVMSLNITKISLEALREETLNKCCNGRESVIDVVNEFYAGTFLLLYLSWKNQIMTIKDSGFVIKDISLLAKRRPHYVLHILRDYQQERRSSSTSEAFTNLTTV
ncbi:LOW QUALITY PROTEIN: ELMO domain-containing protein 3 [Ixodes scapularis]|nr:LOW QUALITY PROTEIN: ELMO domain-containing protein 3 [Ixodes scapularis]